MNARLFRVSMFDWVLAIVLIAASVSVSFSVAGGSSNAGRTAVLFHDGARVEAFDLSHDGIVSRELGAHEIRLEIRAGRIRMLDSDCPRKICAHAGWISGRGQTIVCVPNKVLVEAQGASADGGYDAVSY